MPSKSSKQQRFFQAVKHAKHNPNYGDERLHKVADSMTDSDIDDFANHLAEFKIKKAVLAILKDVKEQVGISEPMYLQEDDESQSSIEPIADEFHREVEWAKYLPQFVGQPLLPKEKEALSNFDVDPVSPTREQLKGQGRITEVWYKGKDKMGVNKITVIKKMKDGGQFSYNAFRKEDRPIPADQQQKMEKDKEMNAAGATPPAGGLPPLQELATYTPPTQMAQEPPALGPTNNPPVGAANPPTTVDDPQNDKNQKKKKTEDVIVIKSILFKDEIRGAAILIEFLKKLNLK